jgi:hypothetical protein
MERDSIAGDQHQLVVTLVAAQEDRIAVAIGFPESEDVDREGDCPVEVDDLQSHVPHAADGGH